MRLWKCFVIRFKCGWTTTLAGVARVVCTNAAASFPLSAITHSTPVKGQRLTISLRWNETFRRFGALFQHSHVRQGKVRHPTVFKHLR